MRDRRWPAILVQGSSLSILTPDRRVIFFCVCADVQPWSGRDRGIPLWFSSSASWQASTVRALATCRISAACWSDWEASPGIEKLAKDKFAANECADPSFIGRSSTRGQRGAASFAHRVGEVKVPSMEQQIHATEECLARVKNPFCNTMRRLLHQRR